MLFGFFNRSRTARKAKRKALRQAAALPPDQQALAAAYALGIRDGLKIAADIRSKLAQHEEAPAC